jgi:glutamine amidotransferase
MMIGIVDYGMGNLRSVEKAFERVGGEVRIITRPEEVPEASKLVVPGQGEFGDAVANLARSGLDRAVREAIERGTPFLGICLGFQLLFESSEESPGAKGFGVLPGKVARFPPGERVPHIGWNQIAVHRSAPLLSGVADGGFFYFAHSYYCIPADPSDVVATTDYGFEYASVVARDGLIGVQFHPEKSQDLGLRILANFAGMA